MSVESLIAKINKAQDLYEILGVTKEVDEASLKTAYRKLALKLHPDKCTQEGGDDAFKKVSNAYATLSDEKQRAHYDRFGSVGDVGHSGGGNPFAGGMPGGAGMPFDPEELFREIFRNHPDMAGGQGGNRARRRGGGGGMPGGMHFSFNGMPMHFDGMGNMGGRQQQPQPVQFELPEPFKTALSVVTAIVPTPFLVVGTMLFGIYAFTWILSFIVQNISYIIVLQMVPLPPPFRTYAYLALFMGSFLGYL